MSSWTPHFFLVPAVQTFTSWICRKRKQSHFHHIEVLLRWIFPRTIPPSYKIPGGTFLDTTILSNQVSIAIYPLYRFLLFHVTFISFNNTRLWVGLLTRIGSTLFKKKNNFKRTQKIDSFFLTLLSLLRFKDLPTQKDVKWLWYEKYVSLSLPNSPEPFSVSLRTPATPQSR